MDISHEFYGVDPDQLASDLGLHCLKIKVLIRTNAAFVTVELF